MVSAILSRIVILVFGTLYPAYASYKAVRTKNVKEYVKWMMYWIVFALFCCIETFSDVFLSWLPFYYELKIIFVLWMLSPMTQGSSFLFKKFVHPQLARREKEIDEMIAQASKQGYSTLLSLGSKGINYASQVMMRTAIMGQSKLVDHLRRSYSTSDLSNDGQALLQRHDASGEEEGEDELDNRLREDNAELEVRSSNKVKLGRSKSAASSYSLSSVKEETEGEGEEEEKVITETYTLPTSTKKHYTLKEDNQDDEHKTRCKSLPPLSHLKRVTGPRSRPSDLKGAKMHQSSSKKKPEKFETVKNEPYSPTTVPRIVELKRSLFTRSHSQDNIIIKRGKAQVLSGLSTDRKRRLLQRAQSEEPSTQRPLSPLVTFDDHWRSKMTTKHAMESVKTDDLSKIPELSSHEEESKSEILNIDSPEETQHRIDDQKSVPFQLIPDKAAVSLQTINETGVRELKTDALKWRLIEESEDLPSIDIADSDLIYIDAEDPDTDSEFEDSFYSSSDLDEEISLSSEIDNRSIEGGDNKDLPENPSYSVHSETSDSDEEDVYSMFDSSETLRSLTPDKEEEVPVLLRPPKPQTLQKVLQIMSYERISPESGSKSLPGSPSMSRGLWREGEEEENQRSVSSPSISYPEPGYSQYLTQAAAVKQRKAPYESPHKKRTSTVLSSRSFDPFRSWTSAKVPSSLAIRPVPMIPPSLRQSNDSPEKRLYTRSVSVDSSDSWYHTYPRALLNTGSSLRDSARARSLSVDRDALPLYRFKQLSQDPSMINLKSKK